jgi:hypothetical protein
VKERAIDESIHESKWLTCSEVAPLFQLFEHLNRSALVKAYPHYPRKLRLFACACVRVFWKQLRDERIVAAVETAEQFAEGLVNFDTLRPARNEARRAGDSVWRANPLSAEAWATRAAIHTVTVNHWTAVRATVTALSQMQCPEKKLASGEGNRRRADLFRDIIGNPFRPVTISPDWLCWSNATVRKMAESIYDQRTFDHLPILADALAEAGCDNSDILGHCRSPGPHVRGCWVVDLLLGRN